MGNLHQHNVFPLLDSLHLRTLPSLEEILHVWNTNESIVELTATEVMNGPISTHSWIRSPQLAPFCNLKVLIVGMCNKLEYIFTLSAARGLVMLEEMEVYGCDNLEVIFLKGRDDEFKIGLPNLKHLSLYGLPKLVGCYNAVDAIEFPQLVELELTGLPLLTSLIHPETETLASSHSDASSSHPFFIEKGPHTVCRFQNLRSLKVWRCNSLRHLSTPSTAISFEELQHLKVEECESLQAIVAAEGREEEEEEEEESAMEVILLPRLNHLHLKSLPSISTISPKGYTLKWSSLKTLQLQYCGGESNIFANKNNIQRGTTTGRKIALTSLEEMEIWGANSRELWHNHFPSGFSYELRDIIMYDCEELSVLFLPHLIRGFHHLQNIRLSNSESLEVVFDLEEELIVGGGPKVAMLNKLGDIKIHDVPRLTHVWKKVPKNFEGFRNLTSLEVGNCGSLRYLFSPSIAKCLVKLQSARIERCGVMEGVISKNWDAEGEEEGQKNVVEIVFFPQLQELNLYDLQRLMCFGPGTCGFDNPSVEAPKVGPTQTHHAVNANTSNSTLIFNEKIALASLEDREIRGTNSMGLWRDHFTGGFSYGLRNMIIYGCDNLLVLFPPYLVQRFHHLKSIWIRNCESLEVVFDLDEKLTVGGKHKLIFLERLDTMNFSDLPKMTHVWKKIPKDLEGFHNLTTLLVNRCDSLRYLFSPLIAKCLVTLEYVRVENCGGMEEVVSRSWDEECQKNSVDIIFFPNLHELVLENLPSLICLGPAGASGNLDELSFETPNNVGTDETHDQEYASTSISNSIFNQKIALTSLEDVEVRRINGFSYGSRSMRLERCHKLPVLFSSHLMKGFHHLEKIELSSCGSLEVVFEFEELIVGGGEKKVVMLNQLDEMRLSSLPRMTHVWKNSPKNFGGFHNLTTLEVERCNSLRYLFSPLIAKCLVKLRKLSIKNSDVMEEVVCKMEEEGEEVQDNSVEMIFFPELHELVLEELPILICLGPAGAYSFNKLSGVPNVGTDETHDQGNPKSSNPTSSASVTFEGIGCSWSLHNLTRVRLYKCHKLLSLFAPNREVRLPVLQNLSIKECDSLKYLFSSSTTRSLVQLRDLTIVDCEMMEVIVKEDEHELQEASDKRSKLVFPSLISLTLTSLLNLRGICLGKLDFEWPSLTSVRIKFCLKMRIFTFGYSSTPVLDGLLINSNLYSLAEGGNVNTTLTGGQQKVQDVDNLALKEEGILTINGFLLAGEHLVAQCHSWSWESGFPQKRDYELPAKRQFLMTRKVPCLRRARGASSSKIVEHQNEADHGGGGDGDDDDKNIPRTRTYDISITYDGRNKAPRLWLKGYDDESKRDLPLELVLEDIAEFHGRELIMVRGHRFLIERHVSLYSGQRPSPFIRVFFDHLTRQGFQPNVQNILQLLMDSLIPTIQYCIP